MDAMEVKMCRLCFAAKNQLIDIFGDLNANIVEIITEHIGEVNIQNKTRIYFEFSSRDSNQKSVDDDLDGKFV